MTFVVATAIQNSQSRNIVASRSRASLGLAALAIGLLFAGCRQSYAEGMRIICDAPKYCCKGAYPDPLDKYRDMNKWIDARVKNEEATAAYFHLDDIPPDQRPKAFLEASRKAGIADSDCPMGILDESWAKDERRPLKEYKVNPAQ